MQTIEPQCQRHLDAARDCWFDVVERDLEASDAGTLMPPAYDAPFRRPSSKAAARQDR
jgi:hypothetical protein